MSDEANTAYVLAMIAVLNATIAGMVAENMQRQHRGESMAYVQADFAQEIKGSGMHHNAVLTTLGNH